MTNSIQTLFQTIQQSFLQFGWQSPVGWLLISILLGVALPWLMRLSSSVSQHRWLMARWLLIPYLGLVTGSLSPQKMGLTAIDWWISLRFGLGITFAIIVLLGIMRVTTALANPASPVTVPSSKPPLNEAASHLNTHTWRHLGPVENVTDSSQPYWGILILGILIEGTQQFHWAFLRSVFTELISLMPDTVIVNTSYLALPLIGTLFLAFPELLLYPIRTSYRLALFVALITTSIVFLYTENFWLCWFLHSCIWLIMVPAKDWFRPA
ncbi:MAG: hypothetical protein AAF639_31515 [Chloroflexota bacterium]